MKATKKKITAPKWRVEICIRLCLHYYFESKTNEEFEKRVIKSMGRHEKEERPLVLKHFKKEIYPVDKKVAYWMWGFGREINLNFYTKYKELKKLGLVIESKK